MYTLQVEYLNMSKSISEVGQILKQHCEQSNEAYQRSVIETEEESRDVITSQVQALNYSKSRIPNIFP